MKTTEQLETVNTHRLQNGDMVRVHGALVRLKNRREIDAGHPDYGPCVRFESDVLETGNFIPRHWLAEPQGWVVQGNKLATWTRVVEGGE